MPDFLAAAALLPQGWASQVCIQADAAGWITAVEPDHAGASHAEPLAGAVLPGIPNLHSHAFQRGMAGGAERRSPAGQDSSRTWRDALYRFAGRLTSDDVQAIATMLYVELLEHGFTHVCEFHYLHHAPNGTPYADPAEMALRHLAAARAAGIGVTLLPSLYRHGGIFGKPAAPEQRRFLNDVDGFARIVEHCRSVVAGDPQAAVGIAPHSLRAVTPAMLAAIVGMDGPIHIHAAEQRGEVEECLAVAHARPVEWLLDNAPVDARWCVIHATHMDAQEIEDLAASGAVAGLCPSTEASLGDGLFPLPGYLARDGLLGIGTDSHVGICPREELRLLETGQRLALSARTVAASEASPHPARRLLDAALQGGAQASGRPIGAIAPGLRCDLIELDPEHPALVARAGDALLDAWVFGPGEGAVRAVICGGQRVVTDGRHRARPETAAAFARTMQRLLA
jgi:formimidoylglutamate deiminase